MGCVWWQQHAAVADTCVSEHRSIAHEFLRQGVPSRRAAPFDQKLLVVWLSRGSG